MNVDVQTLGFPITDALSAHTRRRLKFVMSRHGDRIQRIQVRLGDDNGPRGGVDKFCRIQVVLLDAPVVVVHDLGPDLYDVIDRVAERVGRAVSRHLDRSRSFRRSVRAGIPILASEGFGRIRDQGMPEGAAA